MRTVHSHFYIHFIVIVVVLIMEVVLLRFFISFILSKKLNFKHFYFSLKTVTLPPFLGIGICVFLAVVQLYYLYNFFPNNSLLNDVCEET